VAFERITGSFAPMGPIYIYRYESDGGGGGPQDAATVECNSGKLLLDVHPNPVSREFGIQYELMSEARVKVTLYDAAGRLWGVLVNETQMSGQHFKSFNAEDYPQGVYFIRLQTDKETVVKKVVFLR